MKEKLKVALICHFSNNEIQSIIKPWLKIPEFAPWIPPLVSIFEKCNTTELHVISPHEYIGWNKSFKLRNITYHFFNAHIPLIGRHWPVFLKFDYLSDFQSNKKNVRDIIKKINPDIIHLFGAENAYYSSTILRLRYSHPIVITVQGFISKASFFRNSQLIKKIEIEREIITTINHYITNTESVGRDINILNPTAKIYLKRFPIKIPKAREVKKSFDLVFFAAVCKDKGIEDLLKAVAVVSKIKTDVNLCVIGGGDLTLWKEKAKELNISGNVFWSGFLPTQIDVHDLASTARISVLPTYNDIISGTIVESLFLKLPVVAYNVGSIHEVNRNDKIISLVDKFDIDGLVHSILQLLNNEEFRNEVAEKGYNRAIEMFNYEEEAIRTSFINTYLEVIQDFRTK